MNLPDPHSHPPVAPDPIDAGIDEALRALMEVQPPAGLAQRTLARLEARAAATASQAPSADPGLWPKLRHILALSAIGPGHRLAVTLVAFVAVGCIGLGVLQLAKSSQQSPQRARTELPTARTAPQFAYRAAPPPSPPASPVTRPSAHRSSSHLATPPPRKPKAPEAIAGNSSASPALASYAPSQPAPPLPLTAQELLMMRILRRGEGTELAQLDLARSPEAAAASRAAFHAFFDPATPPHPALNPSPAQPSPPQPSSALTHSANPTPVPGQLTPSTPPGDLP